MNPAGLVRGLRLAGLQWRGAGLAPAGPAILAALGGRAAAFQGPVNGRLGITWGSYSLLGRGRADVPGATAENFLRALPLAAIILLPALLPLTLPGLVGLICAILSGALTSGVGYAVWYAALPGLTQAQGASVQSRVPVITALMGAGALTKPVTWRLGLSSVTSLGGIAVGIGIRRARG